MPNDFFDNLPAADTAEDFFSSLPAEQPREIGLKSSHELKPLLPSHVTAQDEAKAVKTVTDTAYFRHVMGIPMKEETVFQFPLDDTHPEAKNLQSFSGMVVNHWDSTQRAIERADLFSQRNTRLMLGQSTTDLDEQIQAHGAITKYREPKTHLEKAIVLTAEQTPHFLDVTKEASRMGMATAIVGSAGYLAMTGVAAGLPALPAVFSSLYGAGAKVGSAKRLWEVAEGMSFEEMTGRGVNEQDAMLVSRFVVGPLSAALNTIGLRQVSKVIPGMDKILGVATQKAAAKIATTIPQIIGKNAAAAGKMVGVETFTENLDEVAQAAGTQLGIELTNAFDNKGLSGVTVDEIKERMLAVTEATIYATATMGGIGGAVGTVLDVRSITGEAKQREKIVDVIETAMEKTEPVVREKARSTGAVIVGVNEDVDGNVTGLLMADRKTGNFFETGPNPTQTEIAEFTGAEVGIDETIDRIISSEDLDAETEKLFAEEPRTESRPVAEILKDINAAIGEVGSIGKGFNPESVGPLVNELGQAAWDSGARTFEQFTATVKEQAGAAWEAIKEIAAQVWEAVKKFNEELGEVGAVGKDVPVESARHLKSLIMRDLRKLQREDEDSAYGLRVFGDEDAHFIEGDDLPNSYEWIDGDQTDNQYEGTAAFRIQNAGDANAFIRAFAYNRGGNQQKIGIVKGIRAIFDHDMPEAGAVLIEGARLVAVYPRPTALDLVTTQVEAKQKIEKPIPREIGEIIRDLNEVVGQEGMIGGGFDPVAANRLVNELGHAAWDNGARTFEQFSKTIKKQTGQAWEAIKEIVAQAWEAVKKFNEELGEVGAVGKDIGAKKRIRAITGQTDTTDKVSERQALKASFTKAAQAARVAFREGKKEALASAKIDLATIVTKIKTRQAEVVGKIMTEKEKVQRRKTSIRDIRDYFGLTDNDLKKISKKDPRLMSDYEFKKFKDAMQLKAVELAETRQAKLELLSTIDALRLEKVDNYRQALALPHISEMTTEELQKFDQLLSEQQEGDSFLNRRQLETVDRTFLSGIKTWREAREKLANEAGVSIADLESIKVTGWDNFRWDTLLYEANPFYRVLVTRVSAALLDGQLKAHEIESKTYELAKKVQNSVSRGVVERAAPSDETIFNYLESNGEGKKAIAEHMTQEQIDLAHYMQEYFSQALVYLMETKALEKGRENYFVHMRRSFLETIKDDGLTSAVKQMFQNYEQDEMAFGILNDATGQILPLEKFFQFSLRRTGELTPTKNIVKAFLTYVNTFEKKVALDGIIPAMDIYAQSLTPTKYTPRGLEIDRSIKEFTYKYINNKKGRKISFDSVLKQGGRLDLAINGLRTLTTTLDLGLNIISQIASPIGEQAANMLQMGITNQAKGTARWQTAQGKKIVKKYEAFVGRTFWENFTAPGDEVTSRISSALFAGFHVGTRIANGQFLLGMMTDAEFKAGEINTDRLAELKIDMGRFRVVAGDSSLVGSTSLGKAGIQYKSWAIPVLHRTAKDIAVFLKDLKNKPTGEALTTRESVELARIVGIAATITAASAAFASDDDDDSFVGKLLARAYQEANVIYSAFDTKMMVGVPRVFTYIQQLAVNIAATVKLEEYKNKDEMKGPAGLRKQHTPRLIKQFQPKEKKF